MAVSMLSLLQTIWQADGTFPNGSFAFSYGIEGIIALRPAMDTESLARLTATILRQRWASFDRIALLRAWRAGGDIAAIADADAAVEAGTFGDSMRSGSRRNGLAFLAAHSRIGDGFASSLRDEVRAHRTQGHIAVMQGAVWSNLGLDERQSQLASGYTVASGTLAAAVRLNAIGAMDAQRILQSMLPLIDALSAEAVTSDVALSSFVPFVDVASARHTRADLRMFSN